MILTTHALVGAAIGEKINNPWVIITTSLILHFFLDTLRHGEYLNQNSKLKEFWKVAIDLAVGYSIIIIVISSSDFSDISIKNILIGSFASIFPDLLTFLYWKVNFKFLQFYINFHQKFHRYPPFSKEREWNLQNATNDIIVSLIAIFFLLI